MTESVILWWKNEVEELPRFLSRVVAVGCQGQTLHMHTTNASVTAHTLINVTSAHRPWSPQMDWGTLTGSEVHNNSANTG